MRFRNSIRLIYENFDTVYKILLFRLVIIVLLASLISALIMPNIMLIINSAELKSILEIAKDFAKNLLKGNLSESYDDKFRLALSNFYAFIKLKSGRFIVSGFILAAIFYIGRFLSGLSSYAAGAALNDHMSSLSRLGFMHCLVRDLKNAMLYQLIHTTITFFYDIFSVVLCYNLLFGMFKVFGLLSAVLSGAVFVALMALKLTLLSGFMPSIIAGKNKLSSALVHSLKPEKKQFPRLFSTYFVSMFIIIYINVTMAFFTFFSGLLITVPLSYFLITAISFVSFYSSQGKKYFINYDNIIVPKNLRQDEKLLENIEL